MPPLAPAAAEERLRLDSVDWDFYELLLSRLAHRRLFVTYYRGRLEVMSPSPEHEGATGLLGRIIEAFAEELEVPIVGYRSTTFRRKDLECGLEPDECYYIQHARGMQGRKRIELPIDPPPDLVVEVEISARLGVREAIYAALGVPELWRYDGSRLTICRLQASGKYRRRERSAALPLLPPGEVGRFLALGATLDDTSLVRRFRTWVREQRRPGRPRD